MKNGRLIYFILALIIGVIFAFLSRQPCDLDIFMDGAKKFQAGSNPYGGPYIRDLQYYYSPFFAMALSFFSWLPIEVLKFTWMVLILFALWRIAYLFKPYFPMPVWNKRTRLWIGMVMALSAYFVWLNIIATQMTVFIVWAAFESMKMASEKKAISAGLLLGLFINIKLLLLPFLAYLVYRGYFKTAIFTVLAFILFLLLPAMYVGWQHNLDLLSMWWDSVNPKNPEHIIERGSGWHSLSAMLPKYISTENLSKVLLASRLALIALTLFFLNTKPFTASRSPLFQFRELSYLCLVIILIFPHQRYYSYFLLVPAFTYLSFFFMFHFRAISKIMGYISLLIFILCLLILFLGKDLVPDDFYSWMYRYGLMTWAVIGMIPSLGILIPKGIDERITA